MLHTRENGDCMNDKNWQQRLQRVGHMGGFGAGDVGLGYGLHVEGFALDCWWGTSGRPHPLWTGDVLELLVCSLS